MIVKEVESLANRILNCPDHEEALSVVDGITESLGASPQVLWFWYYWSPQIYIAYMEALRGYVKFCLQE